MLPKPEVILTHESDLDGFVSGLLLQRLARKMFGLDVPVQAYHYNFWKSRDLHENSAWVADFAFESRMDKGNWLVLDHHTTEAVPKQATLIHSPVKSAGLLCYELCREHGLASPELDRLVHLNNVADIFVEDDPDFVLANDYANMVKTYQFWNLHAVLRGRLESLLDHPLLEVMAVKRRVEDPIGLEWSRDNIKPLTQTVGFVDTVVGNTNLIVHALLEKQMTKYPVLLTLIRRGNGLIIASLRSRKGEAIKVAERLQGGGHPNAAGAVLPRSLRSIPDAVTYLKQALNPSIQQGGPLHSLEDLFAGLEVKGS